MIETKPKHEATDPVLAAAKQQTRVELAALAAMDLVTVIEHETVAYHRLVHQLNAAYPERFVSADREAA